MKKKLSDITYEKTDGTIKDYTIFMLSSNYISTTGFDVTAMSAEDKADLITVQEEYEEKTKPFMKYFKRFLSARITEKKGEGDV